MTQTLEKKRQQKLSVRVTRYRIKQTKKKLNVTIINMLTEPKDKGMIKNVKECMMRCQIVNINKDRSFKKTQWKFWS